MFYPEVKAHISPSALAAWHTQRSLFVKSYFLGERTPETSAMKGGKRIHALIESGILSVHHNYEHAEETLSFEIDVDGITCKVLGIPDSYELQKKMAVFVDHKSGKENTWDGKKLAGDLKMKTTAWLVWNATGKPAKIKAHIEYIPTQWNPETKEVEPTGGESVDAAEVEYTGEEMEAFTEVIKNTIREINTTYEEWSQSSNEFINQDDVAEYARLAQEIGEREAKQTEIKDRIGTQMEFGKTDTYAGIFGTFYFANKKKYAYPDGLTVKLGEGVEMTLAEAEKIGDAAAMAKKKYETENAPESTTRVLQYRGKKK